jgi:hypothetical protein
MMKYAILDVNYPSSLSFLPQLIEATWETVELTDLPKDSS